METLTFTCETITPMFLTGADGSTPELRAPSIKGALRFWWRAMHGDLSLEDLKKAEGEIFGNTKQRSKVIIVVDDAPERKSEDFLLPHKKQGKSNTFAEKATFTISLKLVRNVCIKLSNERILVFNLDSLQWLFALVCVLGGFGKRSRRGFGSVWIKTINGELFDISLNKPKIEIEQYIKKHINSAFDYAHRSQYPTIKNIEISESSKSVIDIGQATHETAGEFSKHTYASSVGSADSRKEGTKRFATPVYVSIVPKDQGQHAVVTTLEAIPPDGSANPKIQRSLISKILK